MSQLQRVLISLSYLALSTCLVFLFSFMVPSLGHLQDFELPGLGLVDLDLLAPWIMVLTTILISLVFLSEVKLGASQGLKVLEPRALLYFGALWGERTLFIVRMTGDLSLVVLLGLSLFWIALFLGTVKILGAGAPATGGPTRESWREGLGVQFFWVAVFFSFALQVAVKGYGKLGSAQSLGFLGLSYLEFRKLRGSEYLSGWTGAIFLWAYRVTFVALLAILFIKP
jgi:hypothetical protein